MSRCSETRNGFDGAVVAYIPRMGFAKKKYLLIRADGVVGAVFGYPLLQILREIRLAVGAQHKLFAHFGGYLLAQGVLQFLGSYAAAFLQGQLYKLLAQLAYGPLHHKHHAGQILPKVVMALHPVGACVGGEALPVWRPPFSLQIHIPGQR